MPSTTSGAPRAELPLDPEVRQALQAGRARSSAGDAHRLALQAKLTEIGVPPAPDDRAALRQLAEMDTESVDAVLRWLSHAAGVPHGLHSRFLTVDRPGAVAATAPDTRDPADAPAPAAPTHPADRTDPRLLSW